MMTLEEALAGKEIPAEVRRSLTLVNVPYFSFDREVRTGQLVVHTGIAEDIKKIFTQLSQMEFPMEKMVPIVAYGWDDDASMAANNTSAFNYRLIFGTDRLSNHSYGRAIDINPVQNPYVRRDGLTMPLGAKYDLSVPGTITNEIADLFKSHGWEWGGDWVGLKDWQHFQKLT